MRVVELIIDENDNTTGIEAVSIVENPAIEENWVALSKQFRFAKVDDEKRIIMGAILVPDKKILRIDDQGEYHIWFSKETVRKCMELYFKRYNQGNATLEHSKIIEGLTMVESWIVEDSEKDKSAIYGLDLSVGTWCGSIKVDNDEIWNDFVKTGIVKGFSIEGVFADNKETLSNVCITSNEIEDDIIAGLELLEIKQYLDNVCKS